MLRHRQSFSEARNMHDRDKKGFDLLHDLFLLQDL